LTAVISGLGSSHLLTHGEARGHKTSQPAGSVQGNAVSSSSQLGGVPQASAVGTPGKQQMPSASQSSGSWTGTRPTAAQQSWLQGRPKNWEHPRQHYDIGLSAANGAVVDLYRPAGLLTRLQQPYVIEGLLVGSVHDDVQGRVVHESPPHSNVVPFRRQ
jgi:hypothetical protein